MVIIQYIQKFLFIISVAFSMQLLCLNANAQSSNNSELLQDAEIFHGERLFLETRFAQRFYKFLQKGGEVNGLIDVGDPVLDKTVRFFGLPPYQIPFATGSYKGGTFNCRACHLVDEHVEQKELGMRTYADFASRSPVPHREDNLLVTARNSPSIVNVTVSRDNFILHVDGEFSSLDQVVKATLTGRNLGWLPGENQFATEHICQIIREDNGKGELAQEFGAFSYAEVFLGKKKTGAMISHDYLIAKRNRLNVSTSSCNEILQAVSSLIGSYIEDLAFAKDENILSPYDIFLQINGLPNEPKDDESDKEYSARLLSLINDLKQNEKLKFVVRNSNTEHGGFRFHDQAFQFAEQQLAGMELFFNVESKSDQSVGNCISCHPAPHFTDFGLHNIGVTQIEYEAIHGNGAFNKLKIPNTKGREKYSETYLPATNQNPNRKGVFRKPAAEDNRMHTDLGAWNIFQNSDYPLPQKQLYNLICSKPEKCKSNDHALELSIATFKTPSLRDLGHSAPYMHNGQISDLHAVISFYMVTSRSSRNGQLRNIDLEINKIKLAPNDIHPLVLFLISLYEDYH